MKKVEVYSNWAELDQLEGETIHNGDVLRVKWPDGTITTETAVVHTSQDSVVEQGCGITEIPISKAYVQAEVRGAKCLVRLADNKILCEWLKK